MRYDAVFFDSGGTLYGPGGESDPSPSEVWAGRYERVTAALAGCGVRADIDEVTKRLAGLETTCPKTRGDAYTYYLLLIEFCEPLGLGTEVAACLADAYAGPRYASWLFEGTVDTIETLSRSGLRLGVIANTPWPGFCMDRAFSGVGLLPFFGTRVYSGDIGISKPDSRIFRLAESAMHCEGARVLYVGNDLEKDVAGASGVGWSTAFRIPPGGAPSGASDFEFRETPELIGHILEA